MERAQVVNGKLKLPQTVLRWMGSEKEFMISVSGDSLVLKKIHPRRLSEVATRDSTDVPVPMSELVAEVKKVRKSRKRATSSRH